MASALAWAFTRMALASPERERQAQGSQVAPPRLALLPGASPGHSEGVWAEAFLQGERENKAQLLSPPQRRVGAEKGREEACAFHQPSTALLVQAAWKEPLAKVKKSETSSVSAALKMSPPGHPSPRCPLPTGTKHGRGKELRFGPTLPATSRFCAGRTGSLVDPLCFLSL